MENQNNQNFFLKSYRPNNGCMAGAPKYRRILTLSPKPNRKTKIWEPLMLHDSPSVSSEITDTHDSEFNLNKKSIKSEKEIKLFKKYDWEKQIPKTLISSFKSYATPIIKKNIPYEYRHQLSSSNCFRQSKYGAKNFTKEKISLPIRKITKCQTSLKHEKAKFDCKLFRDSSLDDCKDINIEDKKLNSFSKPQFSLPLDLQNLKRKVIQKTPRSNLFHDHIDKTPYNNTSVSLKSSIFDST